MKMGVSDISLSVAAADRCEGKMLNYGLCHKYVLINEFVNDYEQATIVITK